MKNKHVGSDFDDFLREEGIYAEVTSVALKRVIASQLESEMKKQRITPQTMAEKIKISPAAFKRLLDPSIKTVTLKVLERAAAALGKNIKVEFA